MVKPGYTYKYITTTAESLIDEDFLNDAIIATVLRIFVESFCYLFPLSSLSPALRLYEGNSACLA